MPSRVPCFLQAVWLLSVFASANPGAALAQSTPQAKVTVSKNHISLNVVVTDKKGQPIRDLQAGDFTLLDNKEVQTLRLFRAVDADATHQDPVHVVIVVDMINAEANVVAREREQLGEFLRQNQGKLANPTSIATFTQTGANVGQGFTRDGNTLNAMFEKQQTEMRMEGRSAGFWGAADRLTLSLNQLGELVNYEAKIPGRKLVLVIGPGWPMLPWTGAEADRKQRAKIFSSIVQLTNRIEESHVTLYCIYPFELGRNTPFYYQNFLKGISTPKDAEYANLALQVLAEHSGGQVSIGGPVILPGLNTAVRDASTSYEIGFDAAPDDHANEYHAIEVRVDRPNVIVRTIKGYYSHPQVPGP